MHILKLQYFLNINDQDPKYSFSLSLVTHVNNNSGYHPMILRIIKVTLVWVLTPGLQNIALGRRTVP